ncbi:hypothetical protein STENM223S_05823 [Streptomyces tendae]
MGEYWKITTTDGTQYFFGSAKADDSSSKSTWSVPVFGNHAGEPCYKASFADAWCQQAWRWQLDHVVDVRGNAMKYHWKSDTNNYGRNVSETTGDATVTSYDRGGYLDHIDYGLRSGETGKAMAQVYFGVDERCLSACGTFDETNATHWPDVPFDLYCKPGATECKDQYAPSFWTRKRLTSITTKVLTGGAYKDVDTWTLKQGFPSSGDGVSTPMWLESITRTAKAGSTTTLPAVTFTSQQLANRVDKLGDGLAPFMRLRISQVTTETGGTIAVNYSKPDCTVSTLPAKDDSNTTRCYHRKWAFEGDTSKDDWFNTYVVTQVSEGDNLASTPDTVTSYSYLDGAGWTKSTDEFTKAEDRTYSVSRGYGRVQTRTGTGFDAKTLSETRYFRGIDGTQVKDSSRRVSHRPRPVRRHGPRDRDLQRGRHQQADRSHLLHPLALRADRHPHPGWPASHRGPLHRHAEGHNPHHHIRGCTHDRARPQSSTVTGWPSRSLRPETPRRPATSSAPPPHTLATPQAT